MNRAITCGILTLTMVAWNGFAWGETREDAVRKGYTHAIVDPVAVGAPIGHFLLVRKEEAVCAIRFTEYRRGGDAKPPTWYRTGDETSYGKYDWYYRADNTGGFTESNVQSGHDEASYGEWVGLGMLRWNTGRPVVKCGPLRLDWAFMRAIQLRKRDWERVVPDYTLEAAPTKWKDIAEVNPQDPKLIWYRYDEKRSETFFIPIDELSP